MAVDEQDEQINQSHDLLNGVHVDMVVDDHQDEPSHDEAQCPHDTITLEQV